MCALKLTDASLIYRKEQKTKTRKMKKKLKKQNWICSEKNGAGQETIESVRRVEKEV